MRVHGAIALAVCSVTPVAGCLVEGEALYGRPPPLEARADADPASELGLVSPVWADVEPILSRYCFGCHGDPAVEGAPYGFETYEDAAFYGARIAARVRRGTMPPPEAAPLPPVEAAVLVRWQEAGAPP